MDLIDWNGKRSNASGQRLQNGKLSIGLFYIKGPPKHSAISPRTFHLHDDDCHKHARCVAKKMHFAARNIKPVNRNLDDFGSRFSKGNKQLDVECKALLAKAAPDGFVAFALHKFKTTLRIVDRNSRG